jgi:predicted transcriptional regulator
MEDIFFDRKDTLEILNKRLKGFKEGFRQNIAIIGDELLGKTSLMRNFLSNFKDENILPIYIEVRPENFCSFVRRFLGTVLYNLLSDSICELKEDLENLLEKSIESFPKLSLKIKEILSTLDKKANLETFLNLFHLPKIIKEEANKSSLIVLDEFCKIEEFDIKHPLRCKGKTQRIWREWAKIIMLEKETMYILISSEKIKAKNILSSDLSLLFGNFEVIEISSFDHNLSSEFIERTIAPIKLDYQIKEYLINFTGGVPFYLKLICKQILDKAKSQNSEFICQDLFVETLVDLLFAQDGILSQRFFSILKSLNREFLSLLISIASGHNRIKDIASYLHLQKKDISLKLNRLQEKDLIQRSGDFFKISDRVFNFWIRFVYKPELETFKTLELNFRRDEFKRKIFDSIKEFIDAHKKGLLTQIMELFSNFADDRVLIEEKRTRLDQFKEIKPLRFRGREGILGRAKENLWIAMLKEGSVTEDDICEFIHECKKYGKGKIQKRLIITFSDIDINARLLSKESKIETWDNQILNLLSDLYNRPRIVICKDQ